MIRCDNQQILAAEQREVAFQPLVCLHQGIRIALRIAAVAVEHVEVNVVGEDQAALFLSCPFRHLLLRSQVVPGVFRFCDAAMREDVFDFADGVDGNAAVGETFENGLFFRLERKVAPVLRALERAGGAEEGAGDDAADLVFVAQLSSDFAGLVELLDRHDFFVRGDLENGIGAGIGDPFAGFHVLGAEFVEDDRATGSLVAENLTARALLERLYEVGREGRVIGREDVKAGAYLESGDFPVPGNGVLAFGDLLHGPVAGDRVRDGINALDLFAAGDNAGDVAESHGLEGGELEPADRFGDMGKGGGSCVSVVRRIR